METSKMITRRTRLIFRLIGTALFGLGSAGAIWAHDHDHPPIAVKPAEAYRPTAMPDRIILTWAGDPATTQAVTWRTSTDVKQGLAEIAVADGGPGLWRRSAGMPR